MSSRGRCVIAIIADFALSLRSEWARVELRDAKARCKKSETSKGKTKRCSLEHADLVAKMKAW